MAKLYSFGSYYETTIKINGVEVNPENLSFKVQEEVEHFFQIYAGETPVNLKINGDTFTIEEFRDFIPEVHEEESEIEDEEEYFNK